MSNITQNIILRGDSVGTVFVGYMGEKESRGIAFDFAKWQDTYGTGALQFLLQRPGDQDPYPVALEIEGTVATWTPNETDTAISGQAKAQLIYTVDGAIAKTAVFTAVIQQSLGAETDPPDPYETWLESLVRLGSETLGNAQSARSSADAAAESANWADHSADAAFQSESNAKDSEAAAKASEETAAAQALDASRSAATATGAVTEARNYASNAAGSATSAASSASEADASRVAAASAAQVANQAAITANSAAGTASAQATAAAGSAATAAQEASDASASAASAASSASAAGGSATSASGSAAAAAGSASNASASADRAQSIVDGAEADIDAAKDSAVAAVGAAGTAAVQTVQTEGATQTANAKAQADAASASAVAAAGSASSASASATAAGNAQSAAETAAQSIEDSAAQIDANTADILNLKSALNTKAGILRDTASGSVASFIPDATIPDLLGLDVHLSPIQDLHGYDSPWPAGGGNNKWDEDWEVGRLSWTGENYADSKRIRSKGFMPVIAGETYRIVTSNNIQIFYYNSDKEFVSYESASKANQTTITIPTGCDYLRFYTYGTDYGTVYKHDIAINYPSTITTYSPYSNLCPISGHDSVTVNANGTTHTIQLGDTVYGGTLDVTNGTLTVDRAMVDLGTLEWSRYSVSETQNIMGSSDIGLLVDVTIAPISSSYAGTTAATSNANAYNKGNGKCCFLKSGNHRLYIRDDSLDSLTNEEFKAAMSGVQLCYELANPITIDLDPVQIATIANQINNVWADAGDVTVDYAADLKTYIDNKIAAAVAAMS